MLGRLLIHWQAGEACSFSCSWAARRPRLSSDHEWADAWVACRLVEFAATRSASHVTILRRFRPPGPPPRWLIAEPGQTPREFAADVSALLQQRPETRSLHTIPERIVSCYYQVRYGGSDLTAQQRREVETMVATLRSALMRK